MSKQFQTVTMNFAPGKHTRFETMDGKEYLVAPVVMLTVGVHNGSNGPVLYEEQDLSKTPEVWNMKPLVVYHPTHNGQGISACTSSVIESQGVGLIMNALWDGKLRAEAWFDLEKTKKVDDRIVEALEEGNLMEVSTGLFTDNEQEEGSWESTGEDYVAIARNHRPDHLAILPDKIGACSIADGAGLLQTNQTPLTMNALSHSDTYQQIYAKVREMFGRDAWVTDVFPRWFVFSNGGRLFRLGYKVASDMVTVDDGPTEAVVPQTVYRTVEGKLLGNSTVQPTFTPPQENEDMDKKKKVAALVGNEKSSWTEEHTEFLMNQEDSFLDQQLELNTETSEDPPEDPKKEELTDNSQQTQTPPGTPQPASTVEEYIANAPAGMRDVLRSGVDSHSRDRKRLTNVITANANNVFTEDELGRMSFDQLQKTAAGMRPVANTEEVSSATDSDPLFYGAEGSPQNNAANDFEEETLELPMMNWDS